MRIKNFILPLIFLAFALCLEVPLISSTLNLQVAQGEVSVVEQGEVTKIYASDHSVICYNAFSIQGQERLDIVQPDEKATLIIQVDSKGPTEIKNKITANGQVYIVNPHGIYIDKGAELLDGSFHLIGAELLMDEGSHVINHAASSGDIVNHGTVRSNKQVHFIGRHVVNSGTVEAEELKITDTNAKGQLSILHTGTFRAKEIYLEAKEGICELYGRVEAKNQVDEQYGGNISILAKHVRLIGAYIDASGDFGGGVVRLGSQFDKRSDFLAHRTSIDHTSIIDASAIVYGPGGVVLAGSRELTSFDGEIFAKGGLKGGDGGKVMTASQNQLGTFVGHVDTNAAYGQSGLWLREYESEEE